MKPSYHNVDLELTQQQGREGAAPLLDITGAADRLGVPRSFIRRLVLERRVPYFKVGKYVRFEAVDLEDWLASRRVEPLRKA